MNVKYNTGLLCTNSILNCYDTFFQNRRSYKGFMNCSCLQEPIRETERYLGNNRKINFSRCYYIEEGKDNNAKPP